MQFKAAILIFAINLLGCDASRSHEKALSEWRRNEAILNVAIKQGDFDSDQYFRSIIFFQTTTGIVIRGNGSTLGLVPNQDTTQDIRSIKRWCEINCRNLYWDKKTNSVKLIQ